MNLGAIRTALAAVEVRGFHPYRSAVDVVDLPAIVVGNPVSVVYTATYGGRSDVILPLRVIVPRADERSAQDILDAAMSIGVDGSVVDAVELLDGPWQTCGVNNVTEPTAVTVGIAECVEIQFMLTIQARRDQ